MVLNHPSNSQNFRRLDLKPKKKSKRLVKLGILTLVFLALILAIPKLFKFQVKTTSLPKFTSVLSFNLARPTNELDKIISSDLKGVDGDYAIYVESLITKDNVSKGYSLRSSEQFPAASLYKIFLIAAVLKQVEQGSLSLTDTVSADKAHLEEVLGGPEFGYEDASDQISYTVDEALGRVGSISDNFAAVMLAEKIGWDQVQNSANEIGAKNTVIASPIQTSAADVGLFFRLLFEDKIVSPAVSQQIKDYLSLDESDSEDGKTYGQISQSPFTSRIPFGIPSNVKIIHKTGELSRVRHDAGIVYLEGNPYVIVLMSQNLDDENDGIDTLANISKDVFNYYQSQANK